VKVDHTIVNGTNDSNGWYAVNTGTLLLPPIELTGAANATYTWGQNVSDVTLDRVNSMKIKPGGQPTGSISIALLAPDAGDEALDALPSGYHTTSAPYPLISIWRITKVGGGDIPFTVADVTVRYDHSGDMESVGMTAYDLQTGSPCVSEGNPAYTPTTVGGFTETAIDGGPRIPDTVVNMGAF
jgi:hypothetical protein